MPQETLIIIAALLLFGGLHSLTAALGFKATFKKLFGERAYHGLYRLVYNLASIIALAPILWHMGANPGPNVWKIEGGAGDVLLGVQFVALLGALAALAQIDYLRFAGIRQLLALLNFDPLPLPPEPLVTTGVYRLVRHPLYFFSIIFLFATARMTASFFGLALGSTLYFLAGSLLEEKRLAQEKNTEYEDYRRRVAWMIPFLF